MANYTARDLVESGALTPRAFQACAESIRDARTILVTGITGSGKTTLLRALAGLVPPGERMLVIDDCGDLGLEGPHRRHVAVRGPAFRSARESVAEALALAPRVLVIDSVCRPEAGEVLRALGSGRHNGSLLGVGAESVDAALRSLAAWSLLDGLAWADAGRRIAEAIQLGVGLARSAPGIHRVTEVARIKAAEGGWALQDCLRGRDRAPRPAAGKANIRRNGS